MIAEGNDSKRSDYAAEVWQGPPENAVGWWKSQVPDKTSRRKHWAPNEVMLKFFDELAASPDKQDMRYVLTLLLIRRSSSGWKKKSAMRKAPARRSPSIAHAATPLIPFWPSCRCRTGFRDSRKNWQRRYNERIFHERPSLIADAHHRGRAVLRSSGANCPSWTRQRQPALPPVLPPNPTLEQVIDVVNRNGQIQRFASNQATSFAGHALAADEYRFSAAAAAFACACLPTIACAGLDLGSNDAEFWFWIRRNDPPGVYFCRHDQFAALSPARQMIPIQPDWLIDALGVSRSSIRRCRIKGRSCLNGMQGNSARSRRLKDRSRKSRTSILRKAGCWSRSSTMRKAASWSAPKRRRATAATPAFGLLGPPHR